MLSRVNEQQGEATSLKILRAQARLYTEAKHRLLWDYILNGPVMIVASVVVLFASSDLALKWFGAKADLTWALVLLSTLVFLIHEIWLVRGIEYRVNLAARIQEHFDCLLFQLPWTPVHGDCPHDFEIDAAAQRYDEHRSLLKGSDTEKEPDRFDEKPWYSGDFTGLPLVIARHICQRSNFLWDRSQRIKYGITLGGLLVLIVALLAWFCWLRELDWEASIVIVFATVFPGLVLIGEEINSHINSLSTADEALEFSDRQWDEAMATGTIDSLGGRQLQDFLFRQRDSSALIFDRFYEFLKKRHQTEDENLNQKAIDQYRARFPENPEATELMEDRSRSTDGFTPKV